MKHPRLVQRQEKLVARLARVIKQRTYHLARVQSDLSFAVSVLSDRLTGHCGHIHYDGSPATKANHYLDGSFAYLRCELCDEIFCGDRPNKKIEEASRRRRRGLARIAKAKARAKGKSRLSRRATS